MRQPAYFTRHIDHLAVAYVNRELNARQRRYVQQHLRHCAACRERIAADSQLAYDLSALLGQLGAPERGQLSRLYRPIGTALQQDLQQEQALPYQVHRRNAKSRAVNHGLPWGMYPLYSLMITGLMVVGLIIGAAGWPEPARAVALPMVPADVKATSTPMHTEPPNPVVGTSVSTPGVEATAVAQLTFETVGPEAALSMYPAPRHFTTPSDQPDGK